MKKEIKKIDDNKHSLKTFSWDELSYDLIKLEEELFHLRDILKPKEIKALEHLIEVYEEEKRNRITPQSKFYAQMKTQRELVGITDDDLELSF